MTKINYYDSKSILGKLKEGKFQNPKYFSLNYLANMLLLKGKREDLMIIEDLKGKITLFPHQVKTALIYLNEMNGRMLIADEVGLGKTIEAGMIMKELIAREEVKTVLILCPASLTLQWQEEMRDKFRLHFEVNKSVHNWAKCDKIIASIDTAKSPKHMQQIEAIQWDLLLIDEAHKLKNKKTKAYKAMAKIRAQNRLFLTATPMQNSLIELYNVIDLLDPGSLGTLSEFKRSYIADNKGLEIMNQESLNHKLKSIMKRDTRKDTGLDFTKRNVYTTLIEATNEENTLADLAIDFIQGQYQGMDEKKSQLKGVGTLQLMSLTRMLCSCRHAFANSLRRYVKKNELELGNQEKAKQILEINDKLPENNKFTTAIELVKKINEKVIIFTQFLDTQLALMDRLEKEGFKVDIIKGGMSTGEKSYSIKKLKRGKIDVLICTESGSEGLNLQFCHNLINYDLPWNPMRVEQRIGRIHRIGQEFDVNIYNLSVKGTIEEYILQRLYKKVDLFHMAIGEMADIITKVVDETSFEKTVFEMLMENRKKIDFKKKLDELFKKVKESKKFQEDVKAFDDKTLSLFDLSVVKK
ncbi:DEAD/DEAH box helicase family protein [Candidatus Woesearchaeota archaeon]|jgi:SNF2 family DNA or RNA helicase|nr:DEAD/DEAH box helicase family protein [Candidatus Woesearchaeota archaeon]